MALVFEAVYENGVFRPTKPLVGIAEQERVTVSVSSPLTRQTGIAGCVGIMPDEDANEIMEIIEEEFERINPRDWE